MPLRIRAGRHLTKLNLKIPFVVKGFPNQAPEGYAGREAFAAGIRALRMAGGALEDAELDKWFDAALLECIDAGVSIPNGGVKLQLVLSDAVAEAAKFAQEAEEKADATELVKLRRTARDQQQAIRAARAEQQARRAEREAAMRAAAEAKQKAEEEARQAKIRSFKRRKSIKEGHDASFAARVASRREVRGDLADPFSRTPFLDALKAASKPLW